MVTAKTCVNVDAMFYPYKCPFREKNPVLLVENCPFSVLARNTITLQHLIIYFSLPVVVAYGRLKTKETFKLLALKVVTVAYESWWLTRGSTEI